MSDEAEVKAQEQKPEQKAEERQGQTDLPPAMQRKYQEAINQAKSRGERLKELEAKLAEALPYVEKFKGHDEAKALEAQREAEARARQEAEARQKADLDARKERAILRALVGVVPPGDDDLADYAIWKLTTEPSIIFDPESGGFTGLTEARDRLAASPRFASTKPAESARKPAPGLPATTPAAGTTDPKFANLKSFNELLALGREAVNECAEKYPDVYARLKAGQRQGLQNPTRVIPPAAMRSN